jgi:hypothetical protein
MPATVGSTSVAVATSLRTTYTTPLLNSIVVGSIIKATHLNDIADFINAIRTHTHTLTDLIIVKGFGNTGSPSSASRTTSASDIAAVTPPAVAGNTITAAHYATLRNGANDARVHAHTFSDNDGA